MYGSLQPGGPNEHVLAALEGEWQSGHVYGTLEAQGWGAALGYPGLRLNADPTAVPGQVLTSSSLQSLWAYLDEFEGDQYQRVTSQVVLRSGETVEAFVYVLRDT